MTIMRRIVYLFFFVAIGMCVAAQETVQPTTEFEFLTEYGYNLTYQHHANFDLKARTTINRHFELDAALQLSTVNHYTAAVSTRAVFPLPVGDMYLQNRLMYKLLCFAKLYDFNASLSLGYRMDYVNVELGLFARVMDEWKRPVHSEVEPIIEPYNILYRIEAFVRPQASRWNLSLCFSNIDDYQMERMWQPLFMLGGYYCPADHWKVLAGVECKPTGMFHLNAQFYGVVARVGVAYKL